MSIDIKLAELYDTSTNYIFGPTDEKEKYPKKMIPLILNFDPLPVK